MNKFILLLGYLFIASFSTTAIAEETYPLNPNRIDVPGCGAVNISVYPWVYLYNTGFITYHPREKEVTPNPGIQFRFKCYPAADENVIDNYIVLFNQHNQQWELNPRLWRSFNDLESKTWFQSTYKVGQLHVSNANGWVLTKPTGVGNYRARELLFCLIHQVSQKALCGEGIVEYFPDEPDTEEIYKEDNVTKINYEPYVLEFLKSIQFVDSEPTAP